MAHAVRDAYRDQDALRVGNGKPAIAVDWTQDGMAGEVMGVLLSCRSHPGDTLEKRTADTYAAYVIRLGS